MLWVPYENLIDYGGRRHLPQAQRCCMLAEDRPERNRAPCLPNTFSVPKPQHVSCFLFLLASWTELFDQAHPPPAHSFLMWMEGERENFLGGCPILYFLYIKHTSHYWQTCKGCRFIYCRINQIILQVPLRQDERFHQGTVFMALKRGAYLFSGWEDHLLLAHCLCWNVTPFHQKKAVSACFPSFLIGLMMFCIVSAPGINILHHKLSTLCGLPKPGSFLSLPDQFQEVRYARWRGQEKDTKISAFQWVCCYQIL